MAIDHRRMAGAAKQRAKVLLNDGRVGVLVYWPLPAELYNSPREPKRTTKATVVIEGHHVSVPLENIWMTYTPTANGVEEVYECK